MSVSEELIKQTKEKVLKMAREFPYEYLKYGYDEIFYVGPIDIMKLCKGRIYHGDFGIWARKPANQIHELNSVAEECFILLAARHQKDSLENEKQRQEKEKLRPCEEILNYEINGN